MKPIRMTLISTLMGTVAVAIGAVIIYFGDQLLGANLEVFYGIETFNPIWVVALFLVPFIGGLAVSFIYGLGGKILAYFPAVIVRGGNYLYLEITGAVPEGTVLLPIGYWILVVIIAVEAAAVGGIVGEVVIKRTYGRSDKRKLHKRYQKSVSQ